MDEGYYDEEELKRVITSQGLVLDSWVTATDNGWTDPYPFYYAYLVWKSTCNQYGFVIFHYLPKESEGRKRSMFEFDGPYSKAELYERFTRFEKDDGHTGLLKALSKLEHNTSDSDSE